MIKIKNVAVKNFLSIGAVTQSINFNNDELTLVQGENLDLSGGEAGARNGVGKSSIFSALSYALYGQALANIKKENLINRTNEKNMLVSIEFEANGIEYRIDRGRRPNILKFYINNIEQINNDNSQGDSRETQQDIDKILGISYDMFRQIVALNTYNQSFLSMRANDQRVIIEQLLGITLLSEKAELLKEANKKTRDDITREEVTIQAIIEANKRIENQINSLTLRKNVWTKKKNEEILALNEAIAQLNNLDIEKELLTHKQLEEYLNKETELNNFNNQLNKIKKELLREETQKNKLNIDIISLNNNQCHTCGQHIQDGKTLELLTVANDQISKINIIIEKLNLEITNVSNKINILGILPEKPITFYNNIIQAYDHKNQISLLEQKKSQTENEEDTYTEQIENMQLQALQTINYEKINSYKQLLEHQEFLLKLLTSKDSFIRKQIISNNLSYLNTRLSHYLIKLGLPHTVIFQNDLSVEISELGRALDYDNLSMGERTRLNLGLSLSFRDVWENLYTPINILLVDEILDSSLDQAGVENSVAILKNLTRDRKKSVWLISHREELQTRVNQTLHVIKENGFTRFSFDD